MKCEKCGFECDDNSKFCNNCGNKLESEKITCGKCGSKCSKTASFCDNCGNILQKETASEARSVNESLNIIQRGAAAQDFESRKTVNLQNNSDASIPESNKTLQSNEKNNHNRSGFKVWWLVVVTVVVFLFVIICSFIIWGNVYEPTPTTTSYFNESKTTETAKTTTEATTKSEEELAKEKQKYIDSCETYSYKTLERDPDEYFGKKVKFTGEVIQVLESDTRSFAIYRINVNKSEYGNYSDTVYVTYFVPDDSTRILEDDIVTFYGTYLGLYTYESALGSSVTIPNVSAEYIDIDIPSE